MISNLCLQSFRVILRIARAAVGLYTKLISPIVLPVSSQMMIQFLLLILLIVIFPLQIIWIQLWPLLLLILTNFFLTQILRLYQRIFVLTDDTTTHQSSSLFLSEGKSNAILRSSVSCPMGSVVPTSPTPAAVPFPHIPVNKLT